MSVLTKIKSDIKSAGSNRSKFFYVKDGEKSRVRFLEDADNGHEIVFHDSFEQGINVPCQKQFGRHCPYCEDDTLRTRSLYAWSVYDHEQKEIKLFMFAVNNCSPIPNLLANYENYGTLTDRDYMIAVNGKGMARSYTVMGMDKAKFRNPKAKAYSESTVLKIVDEAYPSELDTDEYDKQTKKKPAKKSQPKKQVVEEQDDEWEDEVSENPYEGLSARELYKMCKDKDIDAEPKKKEPYYIALLEEFDKAQDDWGDEDEADDWDEEDGEEDEWEDE